MREFLRRLYEKCLADDIFFMAGAIAFNLVIALFPLLLLGVGIGGYVLSARFGNPADALLSLLGENLPQGRGVDLVELLRGPVMHLLERRSGFTLVGALFFVWIATRLVSTLRITLREVFDIGQDRGPVRGKLFDVQVVVIALILLTMNVGVTVTFEAAMQFGVSLVGLHGSAVGLIQRVLGQALAFLSIWLLFLIVYRYLTARRVPWRTSLVAATFSAVGHELLKQGFSWYATDVADYRSAWGNLATLAVLFFWIYYEAVVFILGGEVAQLSAMRRASRATLRATLEGGT